MTAFSWPTCATPAHPPPSDPPLYLTGLAAFAIGESRLFKPKQRRTAAGTTSATGDRLPANARLATAPLSRPDESAFNFGESDISLIGDAPGKADEGSHKSKELAPGLNLRKAALFTLPACFDICGTTAMNVGLLYTPVSIYQMLRGGLVLWVGVFSVIFLGRKLAKAQWLALATVMAGIAVVGASSLIGPKPTEESLLSTLSSSPSSVSPLVGVALIFVAQLFTASQFVVEEKVMESHAVEPLLAAGFEGTSGLIVTMALLVLAHLTYGRTEAGHGTYFDMATGWHEIIDNPPVWGSSIVIACSIAVYNATGLAVTKSVSATARSTIDSCRSLGIWAVSLYLGWESFKWLQVLGFALLVYGTFVFNGIASFPGWLVAGAEGPGAIVLVADEEEGPVGEGERGVVGIGREVDAMGRPVVKKSGAGRGGETSPLLENVD